MEGEVSGGGRGSSKVSCVWGGGTLELWQSCSEPSHAGAGSGEEALVPRPQSPGATCPSLPWARLQSWAGLRGPRLLILGPQVMQAAFWGTDGSL